MLLERASYARVVYMHLILEDDKCSRVGMESSCVFYCGCSVHACVALRDVCARVGTKRSRPSEPGAVRAQ
jgi:hypothetical protein